MVVILAFAATNTMATRYAVHDDEPQHRARGLLNNMAQKRMVCLYITWRDSKTNHIQTAQKSTIIEQLDTNINLPYRNEEITEESRSQLLICHVTSIIERTACLSIEIRNN
jgi:hypothetical protein